MDNEVSVDEEGELRCSDFEVPLFTSETFIDLFLLHLKNLTQELTEYTREYKIEKTMLNVPDYVLEEDETIRMDNKGECRTPAWQIGKLPNDKVNSNSDDNKKTQTSNTGTEKQQRESYGHGTRAGSPRQCVFMLVVNHQELPIF
ncbi:hypothetical protein E3U43_012725 [Larimichthys crocea]|uniref:Uncharacterized protein n=1 Tax=Larimichthys crocea TaxID=215358 RepID=A0ACD3RSU3_LARCR|nr:hypothetical protein E3U43_012725 [Larimichthys crocea]